MRPVDADNLALNCGGADSQRRRVEEGVDLRASILQVARALHDHRFQFMLLPHCPAALHYKAACDQPHHEGSQCHPEPGGLPPGRSDRQAQGGSCFVPDTVVVGADHAEDVLAGIEIGVSDQTAVAAHFGPLLIETLQQVAIAILLRRNVVQGGELK